MIIRDRIHLHYERRSPSPGASCNRSLIFLHGGGGNGELWHHQLDYFSKHYEVIAVDLPGSGRSSKNVAPGTAISVTAAILSDFTGNTVTNKQVTLIGHSYAGSVMIELLDSLSAAVDSLVYVDSTFISNEWEARRRRTFASNLLSLPLENMTTRIRSWYGEMMGDNLPEKERKLVLGALDQTNPEWLLQIMAATQAPQKRSEFLACREEATAIGIIESDFFTEDDPQSWRKCFQKHYYCRVKGTAHFLFMEKPEEFNQCLTGFLQQL